VNRFAAAWNVLKNWRAPQTSEELLTILNGQRAVDGQNDALTDMPRIGTLYRAVGRIASDIASCPLVIERKSG
jgi:hypothetical protein